VGWRVGKSCLLGSGSGDGEDGDALLFGNLLRLGIFRATELGRVVSSLNEVDVRSTSYSSPLQGLVRSSRRNLQLK
jgi:hypothetical protein